MSNSEILTIALNCALQGIHLKYKSIGLPSPYEESPYFHCINQAIHQRLDKADENYPLHAKQLLIYELTNQLLTQSSQQLSSDEKDRQDTYYLNTLKQIIEQLYLIYDAHHAAFVEMTNNERINSLLIYIYTLDLIHHKADNFYQNKYVYFNHDFLNQQSTPIKAILMFLSPQATPLDCPLFSFRKQLYKIKKIESDKFEYLEGMLEKVDTLDEYMLQKHPFTTAYLSLAIFSFTLKMIENNIDSVSKKQLLTIEFLKKFHMPVAADMRTTPIILKTYYELRNNAKVLHETFKIYQQHHTSFFDFMHDLAIRHLKQFISSKSSERNKPDIIFDLSFSIEAMIIKTKYHNSCELEWPYPKLDSKLFWTKCAQVLKVSAPEHKELTFRKTLLVDSVMLGLVEHHNYQEALELVNFILTLPKDHRFCPSFYQNIIAYSRLKLLLEKFQKHKLLNELVNKEKNILLLNIEKLKTDLTTLFNLYIIHDLLLLASVCITNNKTKNYVSLLKDVLLLLKQDNTPMHNIMTNELESFEIFISTLQLLNQANESLVLPEPTPANMKSLTKLLKINSLPTISLLKTSIINKLSSHASSLLTKNHSIAMHETLLKILDFFMPLLEIMEIDSNEKSDLNDSFQKQSLAVKKAQLIFDLLNGTDDSDMCQKESSKAEKNKKKKLRQKANKSKLKANVEKAQSEVSNEYSSDKQSEQEDSKESSVARAPENPPSSSQEKQQERLILASTNMLALLDCDDDTDTEAEIKALHSSTKMISSSISMPPLEKTKAINSQEWNKVTSRTKKAPTYNEMAKEIKSPTTKAQRISPKQNRKVAQPIKAVPKAAVTPTKTRDEPAASPKKFSTIALDNIGKKQIKKNSVTKNQSAQVASSEQQVFFKPAPYINQQAIPSMLIALSHKIWQLTNTPLILTGNAVKTLYKNQGHIPGEINDYDCLVSYISIYQIADHIRQWAKTENWPITYCECLGVKHPILLLKINTDMGEIKIDISELKITPEQDIAQALLQNAKHRDLVHTSLQLPIINRPDNKLPLSDPLNILPLIEENMIELNSELEDLIKQEKPQKDIFSDDPLRVFRVIKEMVKQPAAPLGPVLQRYLPQLQSFSQQEQLWRKFLDAGYDSKLRRKQLKTKLVYLFTKPAEEVFDILSQFKILEGITGKNQYWSQQWALDFIRPNTPSPTNTSPHHSGLKHDF